MSVRLRVLALSALLALGACGRLGDRGGQDLGGTPDSMPAAASAGTATVVPDPAEALLLEGQEASAEGQEASGQGQEASGVAGSIEERIDRLIAGQERINRRLDSLSAAGGGTASSENGGSGAAQGPSSGEVLGQARESVRGFGVGVAWSILVVIFFNYLIAAMVWLLDTLAERSADRRLFYKRLVPIVRIVLWIFAAYLIVAVIFDIDAQSLIAATAAIGVAVGFAAQDLLKNLFGGLILVFDQPFQVGDKVRVGGTYGEVVSIGLRSTRIVTADDNLVSVPNAQVVDQQVANANAGQLNCQVVTDLYLPGWADEETAKRIAFNAAASSKYVYLNKPIVVLVADVFEETFLTRVRVKAYVLDPRLEFQFQSDVTERARAGFREAGLLRPDHMLSHLALHPPAVAGEVGDPAVETVRPGDEATSHE